MCVCLLRDVQEVGLSRSVCLLESDQWDAVLCALVIDLDFDGQKEVLLGTYGQVSLVYLLKRYVIHSCSTAFVVPRLYAQKHLHT